jgi:uncharacterized protein YjiS (DUF1127 family)
MRYEGPWQGDSIAAPVRGRFDQEDEIFEDFGDWSGNQVDRRADWTDADLAAVKERTGHPDPFGATHAGHRGPTQVRSVAERAGTEPTDLAGRPIWRISVTSILAGLWSRMRHNREIRRIRAAWDTIDDRTLKDIGVSRYELERARNRRYWG